MKQENIVELQRRAQKLMELSSDQSESDVNKQLQNLVYKIKKTQRISSNSQDTVKKCIELLQQNKQLKIELDKSEHRHVRTKQELKKVRSQNMELQEIIKSQQMQTREIGISSHRQIQKYDNKAQGTANKLESDISEVQRKNKNLLNLLQLEKKKNNSLTQFIRAKIPEMQQKLAVLTGQIDIKLKQHYLNECEL